MIIKIDSAEQAEQVLRNIGKLTDKIDNGYYGNITFDIQCDDDIPLVYRKCLDCDNPSEYIGSNVWGLNYHKPSIYCQHCGFAMPTMAAVDLAIRNTIVVFRRYINVSRSD